MQVIELSQVEHQIPLELDELELHIVVSFVPSQQQNEQVEGLQEYSF